MARGGGRLAVRRAASAAALLLGIVTAALATLLVPRDFLLAVLTGELAAGLLGGGLCSMRGLRTVTRSVDASRHQTRGDDPR